MKVYKITDNRKTYFIFANNALEAQSYYESRFYKNFFKKLFFNKKNLQICNVTDKETVITLFGIEVIVPFEVLIEVIDFEAPIELTEIDWVGNEVKILEQLIPAKVYISCPYTADTEEERLANTHKAIEIGLKALKKGYFPIIPHLFHFFDVRIRELGEELSYEDYLKWDLQLMVGCPYFVFEGDSKGVQVELNVAKALGMAIYPSVDYLPKRRTHYFADKLLKAGLELYESSKVA